jgi:serine/threonine protein kinase
MRQLLETLKYLHAHKICHRDIKPDNILFDRINCHITLIDFGVSKVWIEKGIKKEMLTNTGTDDYKAPELYEGGSYTQAIDLWAAGVVLFEMVEKRLPFREEYLLNTIRNIIEIVYIEGP